MRFRSLVTITAFAAMLPVSAMAADGAQIYAQQCAACHGPSGDGVPSLAPPLKGAEFVTSSSVEQIAEVVRAGRAGAAKQHPAFPSVMPPFPNLSDEEVTAVAEYVKNTLQQQ